MKYAQIDPRRDTIQPVAAFYDTDSAHYPGVDFAEPDFVRMSASQWAARDANPYYDTATQRFGPMPQSLLLASARADAAAELRRACDAAITGGFVSSALGSPHVYPSGLADQANLQASIMASLLPGRPADWTTVFACIAPELAAAADWPLEAHTGAQIQHVGSDGKAWVLAQRIRLRELIAAVRAAQTPEAIQALAWTDATP